MTKSITETLSELKVLIRRRLDPLGCTEFEAGAFQTGHVPHVAPSAYLCRWYAGLDNKGIEIAENECGRPISEPYRELLRHMNGADMLGITLHGSIGGFVDRSGQGLGQPISIWYENMVRPEYIPAGHLGIGAINGEWSSQGHLYLASTGEVELYNAQFNMVGATWNSLADFLADEVPRRFSLYDENGAAIKCAKLLPGDTETWEHLAQKAEEEREAESSLFRRILRPFRRD